MIKLMLIGIGVCWVVFAFAPPVIKWFHNRKKKKGDSSEK